MELSQIQQKPILVITAVVAVIILDRIADLMTSFDDRREVANNNMAAAVNRGGMLVGAFIAMSGSLSSESTASFTDDWLRYLADCGVTIALFIIAKPVLDAVILRGVSNTRAIKNRVTSVGAIEAAAYVALGLVLSAALSGSTTRGFGGDVLDTLMFGGIGLVVIAGIYVVYDVVNPRHIDEEIADGDMAEAIDVGSLMVAVALALWPSIGGDSVGTRVDDLSSMATFGAASIVAVVIGRFLARRIFLGRDSRTQAEAGESVSAASIVGAVTLGIGVVAFTITV